jgi:flagellin-like protein
MMMFSSKRGVSPLIATILLIAFAVALGAVVMQLGSGLASDSCSADVQISVSGFICYDGKQIKMSVKNSGNEELGGLGIWVYGSNEGIKIKNLDEVFTSKTMSNLKIDYDSKVYGSINKLEIIPKLKKDKELVSCDGAKLQLSEISDC